MGEDGKEGDGLGTGALGPGRRRGHCFGSLSHCRVNLGLYFLGFYNSVPLFWSSVQERVVGLCDAYRFETVQNGLSLQERVQSEAEKGAPDRKQVPRLYFCCHSEAVMYLPVDNWTSRR